MINYEVTEKIIQSKDMLDQLVTAIIQNPKIFTHSYDKKVNNCFLMDLLTLNFYK